MRVTRILLRNYRGVDEREVRFAPCGVTIVEGPNECGKSSLAEALRVALSEKETSAKKEVRDLKRTDRDVPTEVEVDVESGPYRFTLRKAFNRRSRAELEIHAPKSETLTGGEVQVRIRQILTQTVDTRLLDALWVQQGAKVEQTSLVGCTSLADALDRAAGTVPAGDREETLLERAEKEYARYWTPSGGASRLLVGSARRVEELESHWKAAVEDERRLQGYVEASERLRREIEELQLEESRGSGEYKEWQERLHDVEETEQHIGELKAHMSAAEIERDAAVNARERRNALAGQLADAAGRATAAEAQLSEFDDRLKPVAQQQADAEVERDQVHVDMLGARTLFDLRARDRQHLDDVVHLQLLHERLARVGKASEQVANAQAVIDNVRVDDDAIEELRAVADHRQAEEVRLDALSASAAIEAHQAIMLRLGGEQVHLESGARFERVVSSPIRIDIGDLASLTVGPGIGVDQQQAAVADAERSLQDALARTGARTINEAETLFAQRQEATRGLASAKAQIKQDLRDLTLGELTALVERLTAATTTYAATRPDEPRIAGATEEAQGLETEARENYQVLAERYPVVDAAARAKAAEHQHLFAERVELDAEFRATTAEVHRVGTQLARERADQPDEALTEAAANRTAMHDKRAAALHSAESELEVGGAAGVRLRATNAEQVVAQVRTRLADKKTQLAAAGASIEALSPTGLFTRREEAHAVYEATQDEDERLRQRAAAAKLLRETLRTERTRAQMAYVEPLRREIEGHGRTVFGPDFSVEMDEERLAVARRQLNGVWVSWRQLSVGAQEQLGILTRLAAASLVSADGGAPLIIDDALGHSDDERLDAMCAVLGAAGRSLQIIAFTCTPGRYRRIGGATTISMLDATPPSRTPIAIA